MPSGSTFEQAQAIFKQQADTGGLTGFKVGDALNAATQAADGLAAAAASAKQGLAEALGKLPTGTNLNSIAAGLGPAAAGALNQVSSALSGSIPSVSSLTTGASSLVSGAISGATSGFSGITAGVSSALPALPFSSEIKTSVTSLSGAVTGALTGQAAQLGSVANQAVGSITGALTGTPLNGINMANFAKQGPSLGPIGGLSTSMVTGVMAQASKLIGQTAGDLSNSMGLGKFGFDAKQLETAGFLKPGSAAAFLKTGESDLVSVLQSPTVWTGKDGVTGVNNLLGNEALQNTIQQGLMSSGLTAVKQLGIPTDKLTPTALGGVATLAAKSPEGTVAALTGGSAGALGAGAAALSGLAGGNIDNLSNTIKDVMSNSSFAVKMTEDKIEPPLKQEEPAPVASNTVNTETVDAAGKRVIGNDKVPDTNPTWKKPGYAEIKTWIDWLGNLAAQATALEKRVEPYGNVATITQEEWNSLNDELQIIRADFNSKAKVSQQEIIDAVNKVDDPTDKKILNNGFEKFKENLKLFVKEFTPMKEKIAALANKINTGQTA